MNVILADSNDLIRIGLRTILSAQPDITISGEAINNEELLEQIGAFGVQKPLVEINFSAVKFLRQFKKPI